MTKNKVMIAGVVIAVIGLIGLAVSTNILWALLMVSGIIVEYTAWLGMD